MLPVSAVSKEGSRPIELREIGDNEGLCGEHPRYANVALKQASVITGFKSNGKLHQSLKLANADRLGIAAQVGGSGIRASIITRDQSTKQYVQENFKISNENGRGVHVLFDIFAAVSQSALNVAEVVANISWAGTHRGDVGEINNVGKWNHTNFAVERFHNQPIDIGKILSTKLITNDDSEYSHSLDLRNGVQAEYTPLVQSSSGKKIKLRILHDPHASLITGAKDNPNLEAGDSYAVLIGGTGNNIWLGETWIPESGEFEKYHQTRFGSIPNMFESDDWKQYGKHLEPFRMEALLSRIKQLILDGALSDSNLTQLSNHMGRAELWFAGGQNGDPNAGIKATFNYIRKLILIQVGRVQDTEISKEEAERRLMTIFNLLDLDADQRSTIINKVDSHPILSQDLGATNWASVMDSAKDDILISKLKHNLLERFTTMISCVLGDKRYANVIRKLRGFVVHGGYLNSLLDRHNLKPNFVNQLNCKLGHGMDRKMEVKNIHTHDPYLDGAYRLTLEDLGRQDLG